jgi:hypothetical protein
MTAFMKKNATTLIVAASLGLNLTLAIILLSQPDPRERIRRYYEERGWRGENYRRADWDDRREAMADSIRHNTPSFTPEQLEAMRELRREMFAEIEPLREQINTLQRSIRDELRAEEPALARLDSMTARLMRGQYQIQLRTLRLILAEREILTPEQYRSFLRFMVPGQLGQIDQLYSRDRRGRDDRYGRGGSRDDASRHRGDPGEPDRIGEPPPPPPPFF